MVEPTYISGGKAWLGPAEPAEDVPAPPDTDTVSPRLCRGCGESLPPHRKSFHNKVCQGTWLNKQYAASRAAKKREQSA
jgi:hypothetical protein